MDAAAAETTTREIAQRCVRSDIREVVIGNFFNQSFNARCAGISAIFEPVARTYVLGFVEFVEANTT